MYRHKFFNVITINDSRWQSLLGESTNTYYAGEAKSQATYRN